MKLNFILILLYLAVYLPVIVLNAFMLLQIGLMNFCFCLSMMKWVNLGQVFSRIFSEERKERREKRLKKLGKFINNLQEDITDKVPFPFKKSILKPYQRFVFRRHQELVSAYVKGFFEGARSVKETDVSPQKHKFIDGLKFFLFVQMVFYCVVLVLLFPFFPIVLLVL